MAGCYIRHADQSKRHAWREPGKFRDRTSFRWNDYGAVWRRQSENVAGGWYQQWVSGTLCLDLAYKRKRSERSAQCDDRGVRASQSDSAWRGDSGLFESRQWSCDYRHAE